MASRTADRRPARTRQALMAAFVELLLERGYVNLTIPDIADRANIGRSTLYAHYNGKEAILKESLSRPSHRLSALVDTEVDAAALAELLAHIKEQRKLNKVLLAPPIKSIWIRCLAEMIEGRLEKTSAPGRPSLPLNLVATQLAETQIALIVNWLSLAASMPTDNIAQALIAITRANMTALLGRRGG